MLGGHEPGAELVAAPVCVRGHVWGVWPRSCAGSHSRVSAGSRGPGAVLLAAPCAGGCARSRLFAGECPQCCAGSRKCALCLAHGCACSRRGVLCALCLAARSEREPRLVLGVYLPALWQLAKSTCCFTRFSV